MPLPSTKPNGFRGFSPSQHNLLNIPNRAALMTATANEIKEGSPLIWNAGLLEHAAVTGTNEITQIAITGAPTGGSFTITWNGQTTAAIPYNATALQVQQALEALSNIEVGDVSVAGGQLPGTAITITWVGRQTSTNVNAPTTTDSLTGGAAPATAVTTPTAGVLGRVTSAQLCGFAVGWENGPQSDWPTAFPFAPAGGRLGLPFAGVNTTNTPNKEILYRPLVAGAEFWGAVELGVQVARSMIDTVVDIGWDPLNKQCFVRTASTAGPLLRIMDVAPGEVGKYGGRVLCKVPDSATQMES